MKHRRTLWYAISGGILGMGAPLGWLAWRTAQNALPWGSPLREWAEHRDLYAYLLVGTVVAFAVAGAVAGALADQLVQANLVLRDVAATDDVTGSRNVRSFHEWLNVECARADRGEEPLALIMADIDHFKRVNDRHGHAVGDLALAHFAKLLVRGVRAGDIVCRIGGEEFAIICPGCTLGEAVQVAERVRAMLAETPFVTGAVVESITASFGVAAYKIDVGPAALFSAVDSAMYSAKLAGRNRVSVGPTQVNPYTPTGSS